MSSPGVRRSGRARQQVSTIYDEARAQAEREEDERSVATSASPSPRKRSGAASKPKPKPSKAKAEDSSDDDDDDSSVGSAAATKKRKRAAAAKTKGKAAAAKGKGKKAPPPEDDESSSDESEGGEIDKLMDERPKGKGKGKKAAPLQRLREGPRTSVLFECLLKKLPVDTRMRQWVSAWLEETEEDEAEEGGGPQVIDMFNFLIFSSGATKAYADRESELLPEVDSAEWEALMGGVVQELREGGVPNYPLLEKSAKFRGFRERFAQAWAALVMGARDGNGHHLEALRRVLEVIHGLCECPLVSVRHTACYAGLQIGEALVKETVTLSNKIDVAARQLEAERRKAAAAGAKGQGRKARDLERNIEEFTAHLGELEAVLEEVFNSIFATRYRDVNERVRVHCLDGLGAFVARYPAMFLKDQFIKYLGWMLYDKADAVRAAAARVLLQLYAKPSNLPKLENFTARFLGRMQGLVHDVDEGVRVLAVRILRHLLAAGYLDEAEQEQLDEVDELLLDPTWGLPLRAEAMLFFADHVEGFNEGEDEEAEEEEQEQGESEEEEEEEDEEEGGGGKSKAKAKAKAAAARRSSAASKKGGRQSTGSAAAAKGGGARARRAVMQRLVTVVQFLDYHLKPGANPDAEEGEEEEEDDDDGAERPWPEAYDRLVATCVESFERHPQGGFLYDWPTYFALLKDPAGPTAQAGVAGGLTDREQSLLIRLMAAAVKRAAAADAGGGPWVQAEALKAKEPPSVTGAAAPTGKAAAGGGTVTAAERAVARKRQETLKVALEAFTSGAVEELPKVLRRYKTDGSKLAGLVALPRFLQRDAIAAKGSKGHLEALLKLLKEVYLQGTDPAVLADVAAALAHLRAEDEARLHNVGAVLQAVVAELLGRLADAEGGDGGDGGDGDEDADFNAGLVLLQLGTLAKRLDLGEFLGSGGGGDAGEAAGGEEDAAEALAERVRGVVQARLAGAPAAWGKGFGQALEWRVRVVEEGMQLLYLLLLHSTRGLLRLAMERRPADGAAEGGGEGGGGGGTKAKKKGKKGSKGGADESEGEGVEQEGDEDVGVEEAELVLKQRKTLLAVLSAVLSVGSEETAAAAAIEEDEEASQQSEEGSQGGGSGRRKKGKGKKGKGGPSEEVLKAVADVKTSAYALASDLRFLFRPGIGRYQVLRRVVWAPEPDFLRLLQGHFQREERRYQEAAARADAQDKPEAAEAADAALVRELLDPLIRSVLYTTEALNRRQAAAIAAHFVHSGPRAAESVKYLMKQLKDLDMRTYLEVHMTTLRSCFGKWNGSDAGMDRFVQLAHRMAQTLGVGKISHAKQPQLLDSFVRFLKNGVQYATDDAPRRLPFLEGLQCYLSKLPDHKVRDVARLFKERTAALPPAVTAQLEEERERLEEDPEALISEEGAAFLRFQQDLAAHLNPAGAGGGGGGKGTLASAASKRSPRSPRRSTGSSKKRARSRSRSTSRSRSPARVSAAEALGHEDGDDEVDPIVMADSDDEEAAGGRGRRGGAGGSGSSKGGRGRGRASAASTGLASVREGEEEEEEDIEDEEEEGAGAGAGGKKSARASQSQSQSQRGGKRRKVSAASQSSNLDAVDSEDEEASRGGGGGGAGAQSDAEDSVFGDLGPSQKAGAAASAAAAADAGKGKGKGKKGRK